MSAAPASDTPEATVGPWLPLALLESIRAHDRPRTVLEDEDLTASLPRRLGLTGVIEAQIQRYQEAARRGRKVAVGEVVDLVRLVLRRPDAEPILHDAGVRLAERQFERLPLPSATLIDVLPRAARNALLRRAGKRLLKRVAGPAQIEMDRWPEHARVTNSLLVEAESGRSACTLYAAAFERLIALYTDQRSSVSHTYCAAWSDDACEWSVEILPNDTGDS